MKTIKLHSMKLTAFKGIKSLEIDFSDETNIWGRNGSGKTTIMDAFLWLLFDKDSTGRKDFGIKTLDKNGKPIEQIDHEVEAVISVNGDEIELRKVYSEKWTKKRGSSEAEFTGHETVYYWNGVPMRQMDFQKNISDICEEQVFKMITSPTAFNELHWEERRNILMDLAGEISDEEIAGDNPNYQKVVKELKRLNSDEDYRKKLYASVKKQKDELELIPARIDEVEKGKPGVIDFMKIKADLHQKELRIKTLDEQLEDSTKAYQVELEKINDHNRKLNDAKMKIDNIVYEARREANRQLSETTDDLSDLVSKINSKTTEWKNKMNESNSLLNAIHTLNQKIANISSEMNDKREQWIKLNSEHYAGVENCPTCHQHLPEEMISDMTEKFNSSKTEKLTKIQNYGITLKSEKESVEKQLADSESQLEELKNLADSLKTDIEALEAERTARQNAKIKQPIETIEQRLETILKENQAYADAQKEYADLQAVQPEQPVIDNSQIKIQKQEIQFEIDTLKLELNKKDLIIQADARISELKDEQKKLSQEIAMVDKDLFDLEAFIKLKVEEIERRIKTKFQFVSFRMFKEQVNGGLKPTCDTIVNGVPFPDVNTAGKINAGVDIINTLSDFYGITAPIFLDNRESVTDVLPTGAQLINLIVSPNDLQLRIEAKENLELISK